MGDVLRLFVGLAPSPEVAAHLLSLLPADLPPAARAVPASQVHLTLQFIGERRESELDEIIVSVQRAASGLEAFSLTPELMATLPQGAPSRLVAVLTSCPPALAELQRRLSQRLASAKARSRDAAFVPHLTLARFSPPAPIPRFSRVIDSPPIAFDQVLLQRSYLKPTGAVHQTLATVPLQR